jgi:cation diffusion facilitator family transporter
VHEGSKRAIVAAFAANLGIAVAKVVAFAFTGAASMLAEAIHSLADTGNQALLMLGGRRANRPPDEQHPFGYGTARYFWAFVVALVLFSLGGLFAVVEGIDKLLHPHEVESVGWALGTLAVAIGLESFSLRTVLHEAQPGGARNIVRYVRTTKNPELPVVLLEDIGALIGLFLALCGIGLAWVTGNGRWDALGSLAIGLLLMSIAGLLAVEMASLLIGETAAPEMLASIRAAVTQTTAVRRVIHLRTVHLGPDDVLVAMKLEFDPAFSVAELTSCIDAVEVDVRAAVPEARLIFIEPDLYRDLDDSGR